jgi:hypothetical protein
MSAAESFQHLHTNPVLFVTEPTPVLWTDRMKKFPLNLPSMYYLV